MSWAARFGGARATARRYFAALVPLAGLCELAAHHHFAERAPRFEAWAAVDEPVNRLRQAGDLLVVAPRWAEPMARRELGDQDMPLADLARPDADRYRTAIELSILGQRAPELAGWRELGREKVGKFELRRLENPRPLPVTFDFVGALGPEQVSVQMVGPGVTPCPWAAQAPVLAPGRGGHPTFPARRFACPLGELFNVGVTVIADQDFLPRRCIWAHPPAWGELKIRYRKVDLGEVIAGHGGMDWMIERELHGAPIRLTVKVDGQTVGEAIHRDGQGWARFEFGLGAHAHARGAEVEFAVSSPNYQNRHFCFEANTR